MELKIRLLDLIYPRRCPVCDEIADQAGQFLCRKCHEKIIYIREPYCMKCGKQLSKDEQEYCSDCLKRSMISYRGLRCMITGVWRIRYFDLNMPGGWNMPDFTEESCIRKRHIGCP